MTDRIMHAPRMISPKHFSGTMCGTTGPITINTPTCPKCLEAQKDQTNGK